jgi:excisionase family DNA binding protein
VSEPAFELPIEPLLTLGQVAERLAVSTRTVQRLADRGELVPFYVGSDPRWDPREVAEYLESTRRPGPRRRRRSPQIRPVPGTGGEGFVDRLRSRKP